MLRLMFSQNPLRARRRRNPYQGGTIPSILCHRQSDTSVAKVIRDESKRIAICVDKDGLGFVYLPRVGHETSEQATLVLKGERASGLEEFTADVERYCQVIDVIIGHVVFGHCR